MESLRSQDLHSITALVQQYLQDAEPPGTGVEERSHLAQLCSECILLFQIILKTLHANDDSGSEKRKSLKISLERSYGRMKIWSDENGAADGGLDAKLAASRDLQRDTLKYVVSISQALTERFINLLGIDFGDAGYESVSTLRSLTAAVLEGDSDTSSESGFSDSSTVSVNDVLEDLRVDTTCFLDLDPVLCSPIFQTNSEPTAVLDTTRVTWNPYQPYSDKVSVRFPMAADDLVTRLGKANYARYLRCQEQKATNELGEIPSDQIALSVVDSASSKFHDSGIGSSLPTAGSAYAETVMSYGMGEGGRVQVPPLPARAKEGLPFACMACGRWVTITTNSSWKQHVYGDLEPWICLEAACIFSADTFPTRNDWISHLALDHGMDPEWRTIECPLCRVEVGPGKPSITRHISDHLEEISLSALPADCEFDDESEGTELDGEDKIADNLGSRTERSHNSSNDSRRRTEDFRERQRRYIEHQSSLRSLTSSPDSDNTDMEREVDEFARQIEEEGLLDGVDLENLDLINNKELSGKVGEAYRRHKRERERLRQIEVDTPSNHSSRGNSSETTAANAGPNFHTSTLVPLQERGDMITLAEKAKEDPKLLDLIKRIAEENAPRDELVRFQAMIDQAPKDELSRFQEFIDQTTAESKLRVLKSPSTTTGEPGLSKPGIKQSKHGTKNPQSLGLTSDVSAGDETLMGSSAMGATTGKSIPNDAPQGSARAHEGSRTVTDITFHAAECSSSVIEDSLALRQDLITQREDESAGLEYAQKHPVRFQCTLCPKRFTRAYHLRAHLRTHTGLRTFVCTVCGKAFVAERDRQRHESLHFATKTTVSNGEPEAPKVASGHSADANTSANANSNFNAAALQDNMAPPSLRSEPIPPPHSQVASSYWSVAEMNNFPELLRSYGTDWQAIAQHLTTKTATMVKNFFNKQTGREKPEWRQIAWLADQKVERGEQLPVDSVPVVSQTGRLLETQLAAHLRQQHIAPMELRRARIAEQQRREQIADQAQTKGQMPPPGKSQTFLKPPVEFQLQQQLDQQHQQFKQQVAGFRAHAPEARADREVHATLEKNSLPTTTQTRMTEDDDDEESIEEDVHFLDENNLMALGSKASAPPTKKSKAGKRARKHRREYPSSWGFDKGQMEMKKRVMAVFDGPRRSVKDNAMPSTEHKVQGPLANNESYVTNLDTEITKQAEGFLNATQEEKGIWISDDPTEEDIKAMLDLVDLKRLI